MYMQEEKMSYQCIYPEIYYKVQPFAMMACDELDACNCGMPDHDMVRQISDRIYMDVCRIHPDLAEEGQYQGMSVEAAAAYNMPGSFVEAQQWHRGGFFRDLIDIILLNELFRRRRRYW
ncbi:MAG: hypothetical protein PHC91_02765 [Eubacteriales bacterium]|nr:hypothetical protein [Eubacteriales bacterium]